MEVMRVSIWLRFGDWGVKKSKWGRIFAFFGDFWCFCYTVQRQGLALLALGSARPDPTRARVRARC